MSLMREFEGTFIDVDNVRRLGSDVIDTNSLKRWNGNDWIEVWPDVSKPNGMLGKVIDKYLVNAYYHTENYNNIKQGPSYSEPTSLQRQMGITDVEKRGTRPSLNKQWTDEYWVSSRDVNLIKIAGATRFQCYIHSIRPSTSTVNFRMNYTGFNYIVTSLTNADKYGVFQTNLQGQITEEQVQKYRLNIGAGISRENIWHNFSTHVYVSDIIFY